MAKSYLDGYTDEQKQIAETGYDEWWEFAASTDPIDRKATEDLIGQFYHELGFAKPSFLFLPSPASCLLTHQILHGGNTTNRFRYQMRQIFAVGTNGQMSQTIASAIGRRALVSQFRHAVANDFWSSFSRDLISFPWDRHCSRQLRQLKNPGKAKLLKMTEDVLDEQRAGRFLGKIEGSHAGNFHWRLTPRTKAFYHCWRKMGVKFSPRLNRILDMCLAETKICHWWEPHKDVILVSERPLRVSLDGGGLLHHETGPAVVYSDGWSLYFWHGVGVTKEVVESPETIDPKRIQGEKNEEVRRVMIERYGWDKYLTKYGHLIDRTRNDRDSQWEELYGVYMRSNLMRTKMLLVADPSTGRRYALQVPPDVNNCQEAQQWLSHGLDRLAIHRS